MKKIKLEWTSLRRDGMFLLIPNQMKSMVSPWISWHGMEAIVFYHLFLDLQQEHKTLSSNEQLH